MSKFTFSLFASIFAFLTACSTVETNAPVIISATVPTAVKLGIAKEPKAKPYLIALSTVIDSFALGSDLSPDALQQVIDASKIDELQTPIAKTITADIVNVYTTYYQSAVAKKIATVNNLVPILQSLSSAIKQGVNTPATTPNSVAATS